MLFLCKNFVSFEIWVIFKTYVEREERREREERYWFYWFSWRKKVIISQYGIALLQTNRLTGGKKRKGSNQHKPDNDALYSGGIMYKFYINSETRL